MPSERFRVRGVPKSVRQQAAFHSRHVHAARVEERSGPSSMPHPTIHCGVPSVLASRNEPSRERGFPKVWAFCRWARAARGTSESRCARTLPRWPTRAHERTPHSYCICKRRSSASCPNWASSSPRGMPARSHPSPHKKRTRRSTVEGRSRLHPYLRRAATTSSLAYVGYYLSARPFGGSPRDSAARNSNSWLLLLASAIRRGFERLPYSGVPLGLVRPSACWKIHASGPLCHRLAIHISWCGARLPSASVRLLVSVFGSSLPDAGDVQDAVDALVRHGHAGEGQRQPPAADLAGTVIMVAGAYGREPGPHVGDRVQCRLRLPPGDQFLRSISQEFENPSAWRVFPPAGAR